LRNLLQIKVNSKKQAKFATAIIFYTPWQEQVLKKTKILFCDATLEYCAAKFYQLFSGIGKDEASGLYVPCFWVLLTSKKKELYDTVFGCLKSSLFSQGIIFDPIEIYSDFELGLVMSIK